MDKYNKKKTFENCAERLNEFYQKNADLPEDLVEFEVDEFEYKDGHDGVDLLIDFPLGVGPVSIYDEALVDKPMKDEDQIVEFVKKTLFAQADTLMEVSDSIQIED